jgi:4-amino-4-deoxy-L-arabinose transferase-like glycosyltransferase
MSAARSGKDKLRIPNLPVAVERSYAALPILVIATIACLAPFLNKAFCIDDPLFLWSAKQIQSNPLDFFGGEVNWFGTLSPLYDATKNPPGACYYLALAAKLAGWSEPALHAAFLVPAIGAICGTWFLARSLCRQPMWAALATLAAPAFLVSSTNVMCDTMLICFWVWAVALWIKGLDSGRAEWTAAASLLIAAAALTKYFGICLIPLVAVYTIVRFRKPTWRLAWLMVPVAILAGYQWWTWHRYGRGLLSDAASYALETPALPGTWIERVVPQTATILSFTGGSMIPVLFCAPWLLSKRAMIGMAALALVVALCAKAIDAKDSLAALHMARSFTWTSAFQLGVFTATGVLVFWLALIRVVKSRTAEAWLLALWVLGTFAFAGYLNWTCNVRSVLPMAPAVSILLVQRVEELAAVRARSLRFWRFALLPAIGIALAAAWSDQCLADSARTAATQIAADYLSRTRVLWFEGHWGFQYYMSAQGGREIDVDRVACDPGDVVVIPFNNTNVHAFPPQSVTSLAQFDIPVCGWMSTFDLRAGAGFYTADAGPLPFVFGPAFPQRYGIRKIILPIRVRG